MSELKEQATQAVKDFHEVYTTWYTKWNKTFDIDIMISALICQKEIGDGTEGKIFEDFQYCNVGDKALLNLHFDGFKKSVLRKNLKL